MSTSYRIVGNFYRGSGTSNMGKALGYDGWPIVGRFKFHTPSTGATSISWQTDSYLPDAGHSYHEPELRWAVTTESSGYENQYGATGRTASASNSRLVGSASVDLLPDTDYYVWIWPTTTLYSLLTVGDMGLSVDGVYGTPSTIQADDGSFGSQIPISLVPSGQGALHTVSVSCAGRTETLLTDSSATSCVWTPDLATYAARLPSSGSATATISCQTSYGGNNVGTSTASITVSFAPGSLAPVLTSGWAAASPYNTGAVAGISGYVQGYSQAEVSFDATKVSCRYGASIAGYRIRCGGTEVSASPYRTGVLTGNAEIVCTVIDSRGQEASATLQLSVLSYAQPVITDVSVFRCDSNGTADDAGQYFSARGRAIWSSLDNENSVTLTVAFRQSEAASFGSETTLTNDTASVIGGLSADSSYVIRLTATDTVGNTVTVTVKIATQVWAMKFRPDGLGVGFGKAPEHSKCIEIPADWTIRIGSRVIGENT